MTNQPLTGIKACVFDAYGTLFDVASAAAGCGEMPGAAAGRLATLWREKQLQYTWLRAAQDRHADFWQVTGDALDFALDTLGFDRPALRGRLMERYLALAPFAEVPSVLAALRRAGFATAILSNGTPGMLDAVVAAARLDGMFDAIMSVEEVGIFKPARRVYQLATDRFGCPAAAIAFQSSNAWDIHAASACGLRTVWCNRSGARREHLPGAPEHEITSLTGLLPLLGVPAV